MEICILGLQKQRILLVDAVHIIVVFAMLKVFTKVKIKAIMKKKDKVLYIELKKDIQGILLKYAKEAGISQADLGFAMGFLTSKVGPGQGTRQLMYLLQVYFFSGVYYGKTTKDFTFKYLNKEEKEKRTEEVQQKIAELLQPKDRKIPSYMG